MLNPGFCSDMELAPQTNADRIRAMSDEELAWVTVREIKVWNYVDGYYDAKYKCSDGYVTDDYRAAIDHEVAWLKQPVKDGDNE